MLAILLHLASRPDGAKARLVAALLVKKYPAAYSFNLQRIDDETRIALCTRAAGLCGVGG